MKQEELEIPQPKKADTVVFMEGLSSNEYYMRSQTELKPVLHDIDLVIQKGQVWGISGESFFELKLLLQIMGNITPYYSGKCRLAEQGMMRSKRVILPHVFYIGSPGMAYNNMNVLEFLMFARFNDHTDKVELQEEIFNCLIEIGLGKISLTPIFSLPREYKAVVVLLVAMFSQSQLVIYNFPDYSYDQMLIGAMAKISERFIDSGKTLVISTRCCELIEQACSHTAFLMGGGIAFQGTVQEFREAYDKILLTLWDQNAAVIAEKLGEMLPQYHCEVTGDCLKVRNYGPAESSPKLVYETILNAGFQPEKVSIDPKRVENACEEIVRQYDL